MVRVSAWTVGTVALLPLASSFHGPIQPRSGTPTSLSASPASSPVAETDPDAVARTTPKVGAPMPGKRPNWFHVPAPGGPQSKFAELKVGG